MHTTTTTAPAMAHTKHGRARALCAAGGALAAALAWIVEVPLLGIHLTYRCGGGHIQTIAAGLGHRHRSGCLAARMAASRLAGAAHPARPDSLDHHRAGNAGCVAGNAAGRDDHLGRRRASHDSPDGRGRSNPRHGPHRASTQWPLARWNKIKVSVRLSGKTVLARAYLELVSARVGSCFSRSARSTCGDGT